MTPILLALDAGNSKTDIAVVDADGQVLSETRTEGFRPSTDGVGPALDRLCAGMRSALRAAGNPPVRLMAAYLANADLPVEEEHYARELAGWGMAEQAVVGNDTLALLRSGAPTAVGAAVVCGAGINCAAVSGDGRQFRFPALGRLTGDWGGGRALAWEVMYVAARAEDGRGRESALRRAVAEHFGLPSVRAVGEAVHMGRLDQRRIDELAPLLFAVAETGDAAACQIVERQVDEIVAMARIALETLQLTAEPVDIVLGGGVLAAKHRLLNGPIAQRLLVIAPRARITIPTAPPILGAILLGLDRLGLPADRHASAEARLRARSSDLPYGRA